MAKYNKIISFEEYSKKIAESFNNPFDQLNDKPKEPTNITDKGGLLQIKKEYFNSSRIEVTKKKGKYTVLARTQFARGENVEICPTLILGSEVTAIEKLKDIVFEINREDGEWALVLGYGSLYNHSLKANLDYAYNRLTKQMYFIAKRTIRLGEELTINYGEDYWAARKNYNFLEAENTAENTRTDKNQGMPNIEESEVQPGAADFANKDTAKTFGDPNNPANPAISGIAIKGLGQQ